jgi:uncharacterized protein YidB (DUF937 family)
VDLNQIMKLVSDPTVRQLLQSLLSRMGSGQGGSFDVNKLMSQLQQGGLQQQVQSWVDTGSNQPVTGQQVQQALGSDAIDQAAADAGTTPDDAAKKLANVLPQLVDKASPQGQLPDATALQSAFSQLLGPNAGQGR